MPAMWHVYRCIQEHLSLPPTPTFFDLYHRLRAKPIPFPQRQIQMETPCGRYTQSIRLNWSRRFVALAGWESGRLLVWKMRRLGWMVFPSCVSLILHQNGVFLISSLLFLPGSFFFSILCGSRHDFPTSYSMMVSLLPESRHRTPWLSGSKPAPFWAVRETAIASCLWRNNEYLGWSECDRACLWSHC